MYGPIFSQSLSVYLYYVFNFKNLELLLETDVWKDDVEHR